MKITYGSKNMYMSITYRWVTGNKNPNGSMEIGVKKLKQTHIPRIGERINLYNKADGEFYEVRRIVKQVVWNINRDEEVEVTIILN